MSHRRLTVASVVLFAAALVLLGRQLPLEEGAGQLQTWLVELGPWGPLAFVGAYVLVTILALPASLFTLLAGAVFGPLVGTVAVSIGSTVGAALAFLIARHLARARVSLWLGDHPRFNAIDGAIREGGWRIVALLRLSPAVPFNLQNYLYGLTPIPFWHYVAASWAGMLPGTLLYVLLGHTTGAAVGGRSRSTAEWAALGVGLLATVVATLYITRLAKRRLAEVVVVNDEQAPAPGDEPRRASWKGFVLFGVAALVLVAAVTVTLAPNALQTVLVRLFGPPQVALGESYDDRPAGPTVDHAVFDALLRRHVDADGWVDYAGLRGERDQLQGYLQALAGLQLDPLGRDERLALLINAYNAATLELVLDKAPSDSIREIPTAECWDAVRWTVGGETYSLSQLEHEQIRPHFREPRVHFALVCAAVSCPPLRNEAYTGARLEDQLASQTTYVHAHRDWYDAQAERGEVSLTSLYSWYGGDFEQVSGTVLDYVSAYDPKLAEVLASGASPEIRFLDYDWGLNDVSKRRERARNGLNGS